MGMDLSTSIAPVSSIYSQSQKTPKSPVKMLHILLLCSFLLSSRVAARDFCVADLKAAQVPAGFQCKAVEEVVVDDFVYSGLSKPGETSNITKSVINIASVEQLAGLNGLDIAMARVDLSGGGVIPMHSHPAATELLYVAAGHINAAFISSKNIVYSKTLQKGDIMVVPKGLMHFQVNSGSEPALLWTTFSSSDPGIQILGDALFGHSFLSESIEKVTFLDELEVKKLKALFGGSE